MATKNHSNNSAISKLEKAWPKGQPPTKQQSAALWSRFELAMLSIEISSHASRPNRDAVEMALIARAVELCRPSAKATIKRLCELGKQRVAITSKAMAIAKRHEKPLRELHEANCRALGVTVEQFDAFVATRH